MNDILSAEELEKIAARFRMLGEPMRLRILAALKDGERSVTELVKLTSGNQANISRHLNALFNSGIVGRRKEGTWVYYSIKDETVFELCHAVCRTREDLSCAKKVFG